MEGGETQPTQSEPVDRGDWLHDVLEKNPSILEMRERAIAVTKGYSFANVVHTETMSSSATVNRYTILELIHQHLIATGMYQSAQMLVAESGYDFQASDQPWEKTDLHILTSMGIGHREDPWNVADEPGHHFLPEYIEEDSFSSSYREDPSTVWDELREEELVALNQERRSSFLERAAAGQSEEKFDINPEEKVTSLQQLDDVKRCSLRRLVLIIALKAFNKTSDKQLGEFFLAFHFFTSSEHFLRHLVTIFDTARERFSQEEQSTALLQIYIGVIDAIKKWVNFHGKFIGLHTLELIHRFLTRIQSDEKYKKIKTFVNKLLKETLPNLKYGKCNAEDESEPETPNIPKGNILFSLNLTIFDPEPEEVARQITLIMHQVFFDIHSLEIIRRLSDRSSDLRTPTIDNFDNFCKKLKNVIFEAYVDRKQPKAAFGRLVKIMQCLRALNNFQGVKVICQILRNPVIQETVQMEPNWTEDIRALWESCGGSGKFKSDENRIIESYEASIRELHANNTATIPNLEVEFRAVHKMELMPGIIPDLRIEDGQVNWEYIRVFAQRASVIYDFQNIHYKYYPISQIMKVITREPTRTIEELEDQLYRDALMKSKTI